MSATLFDETRQRCHFARIFLACSSCSPVCQSCRHSKNPLELVQGIFSNFSSTHTYPTDPLDRNRLDLDPWDSSIHRRKKWNSHQSTCPRKEFRAISLAFVEFARAGFSSTQEKQLEPSSGHFHWWLSILHLWLCSSKLLLQRSRKNRAAFQHLASCKNRLKLMGRNSAWWCSPLGNLFALSWVTFFQLRRWVKVN